MRNMMVILLAGGVSAGQATAQNPPPTSAECQRAIDSLQGGSRTVREWGFIPQCGSAGAAALAARLAALGAESDTVYLSDLAGLLLSVKDSGVVRASRAIANNPSATVASRATALDVMLGQYSEGGALVDATGWTHFVGTPRGLSCQMRSFNLSYKYVSPFPADYLTQMAATLDSIVFRPGENAVVRDLAACVRAALKTEVPMATSPGAIVVTYVCGTQFHATNSSSRSANLRHRLQGTTEELGLFVPANGSADFLMMKTGTVEVLENGTVIATVKNGGTGCPLSLEPTTL